MDLLHIRPQTLPSPGEQSEFRPLGYLALPSLLALTFHRTRALPLALPVSERASEREGARGRRERKRLEERGRERERGSEGETGRLMRLRQEGAD